jgi:hypothetical protein
VDAARAPREVAGTLLGTRVVRRGGSRINGESVEPKGVLVVIRG